MKTVKIGIDARLLYQTGIGVYLRNLIFELFRLDDSKNQYFIFAKKNDWNKFLTSYGIPEGKFVHVPCEIGWHGFGEQTVFLFKLYLLNLDLVHFPYFSWPILYLRPFVATIHDTVLLHHTTGRVSTLPFFWRKLKQVVFRFVFWLQTKRASAIFVPSNSVLSEIYKYDNNLRNKVTVTHEGLDYLFAKTDSRIPKNMIKKNKNYYLYVGNAYPHKNVEIIFRAVQLSHDKIDSKVVIVGPKTQFAERLKNDYLFLSERFLWIYDIDVAELKWLYQNALGLIFPSIAEGFGLPVVEAMSVGCPLLLSDIKVFREIAGEGAFFFDPQNAENLLQLMQSKNFPKVSKIDKSILSFSKLAQKTHDIYLSVSNTNN
jgi:glycosyltransferase involved in cell wall biosynthesis